MKFVLGLMAAALLYCFATPVAAATHPPAPSTPQAALHTHAGPAPGDEYFGPLKMSVFGVKNVIERTNLRLDAGVPMDVPATQRYLTQAELSIVAWEARYPHDYWLPRMYAALQRAYVRLPNQNARLHAADLASRLIVRYPGSAEARTMRGELAAMLSATASAVALGPAAAPH